MDTERVVIARPQDASILADFQVKMALETENLKLDGELVLKAVNYLLGATIEGTLHKDAVFLVKLVKEEVVGCLMLTFESKTKWWIMSVFVKKEHRLQGHFKSLFHYSVQLAKEHGADSLKLYVESHNEKAKSAYFKLGMFVIPDKFYVYDFVLGGVKIKEASGKVAVDKVGDEAQAEQWVKQRVNCLNHLQYHSNEWSFSYELKVAGKRVGYAKCFNQFSDWRFGFTTYIRELYLEEGSDCSIQEVVDALMPVLSKASQITCAVIRVIFRGEIKLEGGEVEHYDILELKVQ